MGSSVLVSHPHIAFRKIYYIFTFWNLKYSTIHFCVAIKLVAKIILCHLGIRSNSKVSFTSFMQKCKKLLNKWRIFSRWTRLIARSWTELFAPSLSFVISVPSLRLFPSSRFSFSDRNIDFLLLRFMSFWSHCNLSHSLINWSRLILVRSLKIRHWSSRSF